MTFLYIFLPFVFHYNAKVISIVKCITFIAIMTFFSHAKENFLVKTDNINFKRHFLSLYFFTFFVVFLS